MINLFQSVQAAVEEDAHRRWGWYLALGILLVIVGAYCIYSQTVATLASVIALGILLVIAGIGYVVAMFSARAGAGYAFLLLLAAAFNVIVGLMLIEHPEIAALGLTLLIATLLVVGGVFRFFSAIWFHMPQYGWAAFGGILAVLLGLALWAQWPFSASWFIGFAVGLNFLFDGITWCAMALRVKSIATPLQHA